MKSKFIWLGLFFLTVGVIFVMVFLPSLLVDRSVAYKAGASTQARQVVLALMTYSISGEVRPFPDFLYELEMSGFDNDYLGYKDPESGNSYDWLYYGRGVTPDQETLDSEFILIAAPTLFNNKGQYPKGPETMARVVAYVGGNTAVISENDFITQIKKQRK